jgi:hypothetical protein
VFLRVTVLAGLVEFTATLPKLTAVTETVVCATALVVEIRQKTADSENRTTRRNFPMRFSPRFNIFEPSPTLLRAVPSRDFMSRYLNSVK